MTEELEATGSHPCLLKQRQLFGRNARRYRKQAHLTQAQVATRLGDSINQSYVARYEAGEFNLTLNTMLKIATALRCQVHKLLTPDRPSKSTKETPPG